MDSPTSMLLFGLMLSVVQLSLRITLGCWLMRRPPVDGERPNLRARENQRAATRLLEIYLILDAQRGNGRPGGLLNRSRFDLDTLGLVFEGLHELARLIQKCHVPLYIDSWRRIAPRQRTRVYPKQHDSHRSGCLFAPFDQGAVDRDLDPHESRRRPTPCRSFLDCL